MRKKCIPRETFHTKLVLKTINRWKLILGFHSCYCNLVICWVLVVVIIIHYFKNQVNAKDVCYESSKHWLVRNVCMQGCVYVYILMWMEVHIYSFKTNSQASNISMRDSIKNGTGTLLSTLRFLGRLYNFFNFVIIFSLM